jgi:hypothetical protein
MPSGSPIGILKPIRMHLVLSGMQNRTFGPYLAAMHRILISVVTHTSTAYIGMVNKWCYTHEVSPNSERSVCLSDSLFVRPAARLSNCLSVCFRVRA